jgi:hypothetical protein
MKLTDVARASLSELRGDYEIVILDRNQTEGVGQAKDYAAKMAVRFAYATNGPGAVAPTVRDLINQQKCRRSWTRRRAIFSTCRPTLLMPCQR